MKVVTNKEMQAYRQKVRRLHQELGIPRDYAKRSGLPLQLEARELVEVEPDVFGRIPRLAPEALDAWSRMRDAAAADEIRLQMVSAFRSPEYQRDIFLNKLGRGQSISEILAVNAAPGYSEHHTGLAIDLSCPGFPHLSEEFETSPAFHWLLEKAGDFGFRLSFPRANPHGVMYEPWHWRYWPHEAPSS